MGASLSDFGDASTHVVVRPSDRAGEAALPPVPAAIANAFFNATGKRLRDLPFASDRIKAALT